MVGLALAGFAPFVNVETFGVYQYRWTVTVIAICLAGGSIKIACKVPLDRLEHWGVVVLWTLGPPLYFLSEYYNAGPIHGTEFEYLKHSQELASRFWAGIGAIITLIYAKRKWG